MKQQEFEEAIKAQIDYCLTLLALKGTEYAGEDTDRLSAFKTAAALQSCTSKEALCGMMAKHTISIYDMCRGGEYSHGKWIEKITDNINYLLILRAMLEEESSNETN